MSRRALALRHPVALVGVVLTTISAAVFLALAAAMIAGLLLNPYAGLIVFVALPLLFIVGLLLIPLGVRLDRRRATRTGGETAWPVVDFNQRQTRRTTLAVLMLTAVNLTLLLLAGYGTLHWMESPQFCGQVCHTPMHPQWSAWSAASHRRVACVTCHIGEGADAFVHAKLAGVRQLWHVATSSYPRPIPPGASGMPEAIEVCGRCHDPARDHGVMTWTVKQYADDERATETTTTVRLHVGGPSRPTTAGRAIHWHADPDVVVEYVAVDSGRQTIPYVKVTGPARPVREYLVEGTTPEQIAAGTRRVMSCVDCHSATGHPISPTPEAAVDDALARGALPNELPFVRRESVRVVSATYPSSAEAQAAIERELREVYRRDAGNAGADALGRAVSALQAVYGRNVFPEMQVGWGTYPNNIGHTASSGCFRCHDGRSTASGATISADCEFCHTLPE